MDYLDILKRSWTITWRHRILWLFGLFAGGAVNSSLNYQTSSQDIENLGSFDGVSAQGDRLVEFASRYAGLLIALAVVMFLLLLAAWVVSVAAEGGLVHLANEAAEGRQVRGRDGWAVGFRYWGRVFLIGLVVAIPVLLLIGLVIGASVLIVAPAVSAAGGDAGAAIAGALLGVCCLLALAVPVLFVFGLVISGVYMLGLRYAILEDMGSFDAIGAGWGAFKARWKNVVGIFITLWVVGLVYGIAATVVSLLFVLPATFALLAGNLAVFALLMFLVTVLLLLPNAIYSTLRSVTWTSFYRALIGKDVAASGAGEGGAASQRTAETYLPPPPPLAPDA